MKILIKTVIFVFCLLSAEAGIAKEQLRIAFGGSMPPWVLPETNRGIIIDILEEALSPLGYEIEHIYLPYARRIKSYRQGIVDGVSDMNGNTLKKEGLKGYFTGPAYAYENYAFTLKKRNYQFRSIKDLGDVRLLSWQGAITHLGGEYAEMARNNPLYREHHDQELQVRMLFLERIDAAQLDMQIFKYFLGKVSGEGKIDTSAKINAFPLFGSSPNGFLFRKEKVRNDFTARLKELKQAGVYNEIFKRYAPDYEK